MNLRDSIHLQAFLDALAQLPGEFHKDPADQIIVATARIHDCPLVTKDVKIRNYPHVNCLPTQEWDE